MIISHNLNAMNAHRNMKVSTGEQGKAIEKLSSGYRINRAGDDAAGLAISEKMRAQVNGLEQASRNAQDGISLVQTAEGALTETHSMLQRLKTLATQSANGTYSAGDRASIQKEVSQLTSEITRIADQTDFNGRKVLKTTTTTNMQVGDRTGNTITVSLAAMGNPGGSISSLSLASSATASAAIDTINDAIKSVSDHRATLGAVQNRLEHTIKAVDNTAENIQAAESRIRDTDMAKEMMNYTKTQILANAAQSMLAQANQAPQGVLQLLQ